MEESKKEIIDFVLSELVKKGLIKKENNLKEKTKDLLRNLPRLDIAIEHYKKEIDRLEDSKNTLTGGPKFRRSNIGLETKTTADNDSLDVIETRINILEKTILKIESFKTMVDEIMTARLSEDDINILYKIYTYKENADDIAIELNCDKSTVYRRISRAIDDIKVELFANDYIDSMS